MQPRARSTRKRLTRRSSSEWKEIAASTPPARSSAPGERQRAVELLELVVDGDAQRLEGALGGVPAGEARGRGDRGVDRRRRAPASCRSAARRGGARSRGRSRRRGAPRRSRAARAASRRWSHSATISRARELLVGVHAHVQRRVVGVGEAALARVDLHRGHPEVEVRRGPRGRPRRAAARAPRRSAARMKRIAQDDLARPARRSAPRRAGRGRSRSACRRARGARRPAARDRRRRRCSRPPCLTRRRVQQPESSPASTGTWTAGHVKQDGQLAR